MGSSNSKMQKTQSQSTKLPGFVEEGGQLLVSKGTELANRPFEAYTGDRVADLTGDQTDAFAMLRNLVANAPNVGPAASGLVAQGAGAPTQSIGPAERVVDEGGRLGAISDYTNPHIDAALAPALRRIQEQADAQRKKISGMATGAGAFGDARHGILEAALGRDTSLAQGETAGKMHSDAFTQAIANRQTDQNRFMDVDKANATLAETGANRNIVGGKAMVDVNNANNTGMLEQIRALLSGGTAQQANNQAGLDAAYQEFLRKYGDDFTKMSALGGSLQQAPYSKTTDTYQPDNSSMGWAGSLAGSFLSAI